MRSPLVAPRLVFAVAVLALATSIAVAQQTSSAMLAKLPAIGGSVVPNLVSYSGVLTIDADHPAGVTGVTFLLYRDQQGGAPLWMETQNVTPDRNGHYAVQLGATHAEGMPTQLFTTGEARWLGVQVAGEAEQPRVLLVAVPYAMKAADAETIGGLPPSAFVLAAPVISSSGTVNRATSSASTAAPPAASDVTTSGGTVNTIPLFTAAANIQNSILTQNGTTGVNVLGRLNFPALGTATATTGRNSRPEAFVASSFNSSTTAAVNQTFQWQAEPSGNNTAAPAGSLSLLFGAGAAPPAETGLRINSQGVITFASGQSFPGGNGSVTSVGLTAPTTDFTVSGSPVTGAGTLNFAWTVIPTSAYIKHAIVKRDANGAFQAGEITGSTTGDLAGVIGQNSGTGYGIYGLTTGSAGQGVWGESYGTGNTNGASSDGVHGVTHTIHGSGVAGINTDPGGIGTYGLGGGYGMFASSNNGVGVYGSGGGWAFQSVGHASQDRSSGGWVKAMVYVNASKAPYKIVRCFNSTLTGSAATTPPCGINLTENAIGYFDVGLGFEVDDRFWSATATRRFLEASNVATIVNVESVSGSPDDLLVILQDTGGNGANADFTLIVY